MEFEYYVRVIIKVTAQVLQRFRDGIDRRRRALHESVEKQQHHDNASARASRHTEIAYLRGLRTEVHPIHHIPLPENQIRTRRKYISRYSDDTTGCSIF